MYQYNLAHLSSPEFQVSINNFCDSLQCSLKIVRTIHPKQKSSQNHQIKKINKKNNKQRFVE